MQRRRTAEDEINMRTIFREGDLISVSAYIMLGYAFADLAFGPVGL